MVRRAAIRRRGALTGVFVVEDGRADFRLLMIADDAPEDSEVEVLAGLKDGETIVPEPTADLEVGTPVEATP